MIRTTVIVPAAEAGWEIWRCNGRAAEWKGATGHPQEGAGNGASLVLALPARACRTFAFSAPTEDRQLVRKLAFAQLEKRGLANAGAEETPFDCHVVAQENGRSLVTVDVVTPHGAAAMNGASPAAIIPSARLFPIPEGKLVVVEEQGRLVLCAGTRGSLLHTQTVSATRELNGHAGPEIRIASLALQQQGVLQNVTGVELWGDFSPEEAEGLSRELGLPVEGKPRPAPDSPALRRQASRRLLPASSRQELRRRRLRTARWLVAAMLLLPVLWWLNGHRRDLAALEAEAARIEATLDVPGSGERQEEQEQLRAEHEFVANAQARWAALRMALEPRRYPVAHLDGLARCLSAGDVVLTRFESKVTEVTVGGAARSAMDAYNYFNAVSADAGLKVYSWSMLQPGIGADGSAAFEIKGKMR